MPTNNYNINTTDDQHEMLTEVDSNDNVIGPISRKECHNQTRKPWHRSTHMYLFNELGQLYFSKRSLKKDTAPGLWTVSAGGHVKYKLTPELTIEKELEEELNLHVEAELIDKLVIDYGSEREVIYIFAGSTNQIPEINEEEVSEIKPFDLKDIISLFKVGKFDLSGGSRDTFKHVINTGSLINYSLKL